MTAWQSDTILNCGIFGPLCNFYLHKAAGIKAVLMCLLCILAALIQTDARVRSDVCLVKAGHERKYTTRQINGEIRHAGFLLISFFGV